MMDNIIKQYGFESNITITFCGLAEKGNLSDSMLRKIYDELMGQDILAHRKRGNNESARYKQMPIHSKYHK